jgi:hypothetical protein
MQILVSVPSWRGLADTNRDCPSTRHAHDLDTVHRRATADVEVKGVEGGEAIEEGAEEREEGRAHCPAAEIEEIEAASDEWATEVEAAANEARVAEAREAEAVTSEWERIQDIGLSWLGWLCQVRGGSLDTAAGQDGRAGSQQRHIQS